MLVMKQQEKEVFIHRPLEHVFAKAKVPIYAPVAVNF